MLHFPALVCMSSYILFLLASWIFFRGFGMSYFVRIVWSYDGTILVLFISLLTSDLSFRVVSFVLMGLFFFCPTIFSSIVFSDLVIFLVVTGFLLVILFYYYYSLIRVFHICVSRWFFIWVWLTSSLLKTPGLSSVFWTFLIMLSSGGSTLVHQRPSHPGPLIII